MLEVSGGTITSKTGVGLLNLNDGTVKITGGTLNGINYSIQNSAGILEISGTTNISTCGDDCRTPAITNRNGATTTISGGTITSAGYGIANDGTLNMSGGTVTSGIELNIHNSGDGIFNITGGTITLTSTPTSTGFITSIENYGALNISGGTIITNAQIFNAKTTDYSGTLNISGGTIKSAGSYTIYNSGISKIVGGTITAENGTAISNSGTLNVSGATNIVTLADYKVAIDNNSGANANITGGTIKGTNYAIRNGGMIEIGGTTNIITTATNITSTGEANRYPALGNQKGATATISGGTITSSGYGISNDGKMDIRGGTVTSGIELIIHNSGMLNISGGTIEFAPITTNWIRNIENHGTLNITGGTIKTTASRGETISNHNILNISGTANIIYTSTNVMDKNFDLTQSIIRNREGAAVTISGGTISSNLNGIINDGTLKIENGAKITIDSTNTSSYAIASGYYR